jgi:hypothetical protein
MARIQHVLVRPLAPTSTQATVIKTLTDNSLASSVRLSVRPSVRACCSGYLMRTAVLPAVKRGGPDLRVPVPGSHATLSARFTISRSNPSDVNACRRPPAACNVCAARPPETSPIHVINILPSAPIKLPCIAVLQMAKSTCEAPIPSVRSPLAEADSMTRISLCPRSAMQSLQPAFAKHNRHHPDNHVPRLEPLYLASLCYFFTCACDTKSQHPA